MDEVALYNVLDYWGERVPDKEAINDGLRRVTYGELKEESRQLAIALSQLNIRKGNKILCILPNWHELITLFYAAAKIGAVFVPCNTLNEEVEIRYQLEKIRPKAVFTALESHLEWLSNYNDNCAVVTVRFEKKGYWSFSDLLLSGKNGNGQLEEVQINPDDDILSIMFTSGTTGEAKGAMLTHKNLYCTAVKIGHRLKCTDQDVFLVPLPCCHIFGLVTGVIIPICFGGKTVLMQKFDPERALLLIDEERITVKCGVPTMFILELQEYRMNKMDLSSLRTGIVAGDFCPENIVRDICRCLNCNIMIAYGSTETGVVSMTSFEDDIFTRSRTVGRAFDGVEIKIVDEKGQPVGPGEVGELLCKGFGVMKGYYEMPCETEKVFDQDGWFYTGDLATVDQNGYIRIAGRKKDVIIRGGYNIYPAEVENVYRLHPDVLDVCVLGVPNEVLGEETHVFIKLKKNSMVTEESLRMYAVGKIAKYKIPDKIIMIEEMPRLYNGKINKKSLRLLARRQKN